MNNINALFKRKLEIGEEIHLTYKEVSGVEDELAPPHNLSPFIISRLSRFTGAALCQYEIPRSTDMRIPPGVFPARARAYEIVAMKPVGIIKPPEGKPVASLGFNMTSGAIESFTSYHISGAFYDGVNDTGNASETFLCHGLKRPIIVINDPIHGDITTETSGWDSGSLQGVWSQ